MKETAVVIADNEALWWHEPNDRSAGAIPDSALLWQILWDNRDVVTAVAHTHPGSGDPNPSTEDLSTFRAIEAGLGKQLDWYIVNADSVICVSVPARVDRNTIYNIERVAEPPWADELRRRSGIEVPEPKVTQAALVFCSACGSNAVDVTAWETEHTCLFHCRGCDFESYVTGFTVGRFISDPPDEWVEDVLVPEAAADRARKQ
jgi:hypothetical protein